MNIIIQDKNNLGGLARIWLIPSPLITTVQNNASTWLYKLPAGWDADAWQFTPIFQSGSFTEDLKTATAGNYYEPTVSFKIPKISGYSQDFIRIASATPMAVLMLTQNDQYLLAGNAGYPMRLQAGSQTGAEIADLNHIALTYSGKNINPALYCANPF